MVTIQSNEEEAPYATPQATQGRSRVASAAAVVALVPAGAAGKISPVDTSCTNGGGNQPGGQQPTCRAGVSISRARIKTPLVTLRAGTTS